MEGEYKLKGMPKEERKKLMKKFWWGKVEDKKLAKFISSEAAKAFYVLAAIQLVIGWFINGPLALIDAVLFAGLAYLMVRFMSRVAAVILLVLSSLTIFTTFFNLALGGSGGTNLVLALLFFYMSIRATSATFAYQKMSKGGPTAPGAPIVK